jgi:hypothetical protein
LDNLTREIDSLNINEKLDVITLKLEASGCFSTISMYLELCDGGTTVHFTEVWQSRVPTNIKKNFFWQLIGSILPSSDQIRKRHGPTNGECALCGEWED